MIDSKSSNQTIYNYVLRGVIAALLVVTSFYVLISAYYTAKDQAIEQLNVQQRILAKAASKGIETYFSTKKDLLLALSQSNSVMDLDENGKNILKQFFNMHPGDYQAITRMNAAGKIIYSYPDESAIGSDLTKQPHVQRLLQTHEPVLSNVFLSVQGFHTIALHVPLFKDSEFIGSIAVLLPFDRIAKDFVSGIKIGETGYAFLLSKEGTELYCPVPGHIGISIDETCKDYQSILRMKDQMLQGKEGITTYDFGMIRDQSVMNIKKYAVYMPIQLDQTFWSICVASPEGEALGFIDGFRKRWFMAALLLVFAFAYCGFWIIRAYYSVQRKTKELALVAGDLQKANERLMEVDKIKSNFVESVSHELRTPMTSIIGFIKLINKEFNKFFAPLADTDALLKKKADRIVDNLGIIEFEGERLTRLINDVLDSAKIESGSMKWDDQIFQIKDCAWLAVNTIKGQITSDIAIIFTDDGTSPWIKADPDRIMQVLINLLNNAVKFTRSGDIAVSLTSPSNAWLEVSVSDTGVGIPRDDLDKIFEKFHQVLGRERADGKPTGTGLGLAICKQVIEHYGGRIWVESQVGQGSRFLFTLPIHDAAR